MTIIHRLHEAKMDKNLNQAEDEDCHTARSAHQFELYGLTWSPVPAKWIHTGLFFGHLLGTISWNLKTKKYIY